MTTTIVPPTQTTVNVDASPLLTLGLALLNDGVSVIPIDHTSKRPHFDLLPQICAWPRETDREGRLDAGRGKGSWETFKHTHATPDELRDWIAKGARALAAITGEISGGLEVIDFDVIERTGEYLYPEWAEDVADLADGLPSQATGGGGRQIAYRYPLRDGQTRDGNLKLAYLPDAETRRGESVAIETRGEGGYFVLPHSAHPSGNTYQPDGGDWTHIPVISAARRDSLVSAARRLDQSKEHAPQPAQRPAKETTYRPSLNGQASVIDVFNEKHSIESQLEAAGYLPRGRRYYHPQGGDPKRPGVIILDNKSYHHDSDDPLSDGYAHSAFDVFCQMNHDGDVKAAVRDAARALGVAYAPHVSAARGPVSAAPTLDTAAGTDDSNVDESEYLNGLNRTDAGNAEALALIYGETLRYCNTRRKWLTWDGSRWCIDDDGQASRAAVDVARRRYQAAVAISDLDERRKAANWAMSSENSSKIESALKLAGNLQPFTTTINRYDADPMVAATPTATLDLVTGAARPPERDDYLTMALGASYTAGARCPRWLQFLSEVFAGDTALIAYLQRAVGYCLTGDTREQKVFLCYGGGANGKSTFLEVLTWLLGDYSANASFDTFDAARRSDSTNDLAALKGRRLVTVIETEEDRRLAEARVKAVTGGDLITARFLYGEFFSYRPQFKIWLAMNHKPVIRGTDRGIWRRLQLIPFMQNFEGREDKTLRDTLRDELPGILNWALDGLRAWQRDGLGTCAAVTQATREYQEESDQVGRWLSDNTAQGRTHSAVAAAAYANYVQWCEANGERPFSQTMWGRRLGERGYIRERTSRAWSWVGFGLVDNTRSGANSGESDQCDQYDPDSGKVPMENSPRVLSRKTDQTDHTDHKTEPTPQKETHEPPNEAPALPEPWQLVKCDHVGAPARYGSYWIAIGPDEQHTELSQYKDDVIRWAWRLHEQRQAAAD